MTRLFPRSSMRLPAETNRVVQVKYTNPSNSDVAHKFLILCVGPTDIGSAGSRVRSGKV